MDLFILKLQITENLRKLDMSENSKIVYDFQQNELREDNFVVIIIIIIIIIIKSLFKVNKTLQFFYNFQ